jgi:hypothetical protein
VSVTAPNITGPGTVPENNNRKTHINALKTSILYREFDFIML